jgi:hypothetical protein
VLTAHAVPDAAAAARAVAGGRSSLLLANAPAEARSALQDAVHGAAAAGVQGALAVSGVVGLLGGVLTLALIRPACSTEPVAATDVELAPESA